VATLSRYGLPIAALLFMLGTGPILGQPSSHVESEAELLANIKREQNPVKKAKIEIRLGRLKLRHAISAYDQGHIEDGAQFVAAYVDRMTSCLKTLQGSGRQAVRQPQGFKELDIALREDSRLLEDMARRVSYFDRAPIEKAAKQIEQLRTDVLRALFPAERPASSGPDSTGMGIRIADLAR
jgi:hypothetical protein